MDSNSDSVRLILALAKLIALVSIFYFGIPFIWSQVKLLTPGKLALYSLVVSAVPVVIIIGDAVRHGGKFSDFGAAFSWITLLTVPITIFGLITAGIWKAFF